MKNGIFFSKLTCTEAFLAPYYDFLSQYSLAGDALFKAGKQAVAD